MLFIVLAIFSIIVFFLEFCYINDSLEEHFSMNVIPLIKLFDDCIMTVKKGGRGRVVFLSKVFF